MEQNTLTAQEKLAKIQEHLAAPKNQVMVATAYKAAIYRSKHVGMFKVSGNNLFVQRGKSWDCIDYCAIRYGSPKAA